MDNTLNLSGDKDAVLKQIDALHEQHRLQKLRELLDRSEYLRYANHNGRTKIIYTMPVEDIILSLLPYNKNIPPELTFGEPYDSAFGAFVDNYKHLLSLIPVFLHLLWRHAEQLPMFIIYALQCNRAWIDDSQINKIEEEIYDKIQLLSRGTQLTSIDELQSALKNTTLSQLDIVYIAVILDQIECYHQGLSLMDFVSVMHITNN